jgi:hypothetical protein
MKKSFGGRSVGILAALGLLLAACGNDGEAVSREGSATLAPVGGSGVSGQAALRWSSDTKVLTVTLEFEGLEEGVRYMGLIAPGCEPRSGLIHQLGTAIGGADGTGRITAEVADVESIDLDGGWAIKVGRPPMGEQACGEVGPS